MKAGRNAKADKGFQEGQGRQGKRGRAREAQQGKSVQG
jgi:hypothetical protein